MKIARLIGSVIIGGGGGDVTAPTCVITCAQTSPTATTPLNYTITFSEDVTGFEVGDFALAVSGGTVTKSDFTAVSGSVYTCNGAPSIAGNVTANVAAGVCTDVAGNPNTAASELSITSMLTLLDKFTTDEAAAIATPRSCEPLGQLTVNDTGTNISIASGELKIVGNGTYNNNIKSVAAVTQALGTCIQWKRKESGSVLTYEGIINAAANRYMAFRSEYTAAMFVNSGGSGVSTGIAIPSNEYWNVWVIFRTAGYWLVANNGTWTKLLYPMNSNPNALWSGLTTVHTMGTNLATLTMDNLMWRTIAAPWAGEYDPAAARVATPSVNEVMTGVADAITEFTWQAVTGEVVELSIRRTDDDNRIIVRGDQGGSTIKLIKVEGGSETELNSVAQTWTNGTTYRICVTADGNALRSYVNDVSKNTATSAFNATATGVKINKAGTNLIAWARNITGTALTALNVPF